MIRVWPLSALVILFLTTSPNLAWTAPVSGEQREIFVMMNVFEAKTHFEEAQKMCKSKVAASSYGSYGIIYRVVITEHDFSIDDAIKCWKQFPEVKDAAYYQVPAIEIRSLFGSVKIGMTRDEAHTAALLGAMNIAPRPGRNTSIFLSDDYIGVYWNYVLLPVPKASVIIYLKDGYVSCVIYFISDGKEILERSYNTLDISSCEK